MSHAVAVAGWIGIVSAFVVLELVGRLRPARVPTVRDIVGLFERYRAGRWLLLAVWLWVGGHLFVR